MALKLKLPGYGTLYSRNIHRAVNLYSRSPNATAAGGKGVSLASAPMFGAPNLQATRFFRNSTALKALQAGIVGLPNVGKSTLFNAIVENGKAQVRQHQALVFLAAQQQYS